MFRSPTVAHAHCDLYCGVYDPAQAKIEAMSVMKAAQKYHDSSEEDFRTRAIMIKEERAELVKHHLMVLWVDFFTPDHRQQFPDLDDLFWRAIRAASDAKKSLDPADGQKLIDLVDQVADIFWQTDKAKDAGLYPPS
ncbi:MAG TPA: superoxide dismutase, Ni [Acidimicrobiia bacterium]|jgi:nickel superoxide dismutase|nr:superoxide dismutase, Ni [Acidimicrobiia bacterium]